MTQPHILITGMSGLIGGVARRQLQDTYTLSALNRSDVPGIPCTCADLADFDAIRPAFDHVDTVVHLAANASGGATWAELHQANVVGTYNVFEAARQAGVKRVIILMEHVARKKDGGYDLKILPQCTLPLTGVGVVNRIITDMAVMDVTPEGLKLVELAPDVTREQVQERTGVTLI